MRATLFGMCMAFSLNALAGVENISGTYQLDRDFQMQLKAVHGKLYMLAAFHPCYRMETDARRAHCTVPDGRLVPMPWAALSQKGKNDFLLDDVRMRFRFSGDSLLVEQDAQHIIFPHPQGSTLHLRRVSKALAPLPQPKAIKLDENQLRELEGVYSDKDHDVLVRLDHGVLSARPTQGRAVVLLPESPSLFFTPLFSMAVQAERGADGKVAQLRWFMQGSDQVTVRAAPDHVARVPANTDLKSCKSGAPGGTDLERGRFLAKDQVASSALDDTVPICVYLPPGYQDDGQRRYPVIYATDGEYIESLATLLEERKLSAIVIGLGGFERRDINLTLPGARDYFRFMVDEAMPQMEVRYRIDPTQRILSGHSLGGNFVALAALLEDPAHPHFAHYLASDASFWTTPLELAEMIDRHPPGMPLHLVLSGAGQGNGQVVRETYHALRARRFKDLKLELIDLPQENHGTVEHLTLERSLERIIARGQPVLGPLRAEVDGRQVSLEYVGQGRYQARVHLDAGAHAAGLPGQAPLLQTVAQPGDYVLRVVVDQEPVLAMAPAVSRFAREPIYLRGSMNNWGTTTPLKQVDGQRFQVELALEAGRYEFKFGSQDFQSIDFGAAPTRPEVAPERASRLVPVGANMVLTTGEAARWRFTFDATRPDAPQVLAERIGRL